MKLNNTSGLFGLLIYSSFFIKSMNQDIVIDYYLGPCRTSIEKINLLYNNTTTTIDSNNIILDKTPMYKIIGFVTSYNNILQELPEKLKLNQQIENTFKKICDHHMFGNSLKNLIITNSINENPVYKFYIIEDKYKRIIIFNDTGFTSYSPATQNDYPGDLLWIDQSHALSAKDCKIRLIKLCHDTERYRIKEIFTLPKKILGCYQRRLIQHPTKPDNFYWHLVTHDKNYTIRFSYVLDRITILEETSQDRTEKAPIIRPIDSKDISIIITENGFYYYLKNLKPSFTMKLSFKEGIRRLEELEKKLRIIYKYQCKNDPNFFDYQIFLKKHPSRKNFIMNWISELIKSE